MTPANAAKPLIPYLRQSRAKEHSISIEEQLRSIIRWADTHGVALAPEPVIERNVSGKKDWKERELGRAVEACQRGDAGGIIVAWQDRLSRENGLATSEVWYALQDAQARLVSTEENLDTSRGDEELNFGLRALMAREGWKRHAANWRKAKHHAWEAGIYNANAPAGYTAVAGRLVPNEHADAVREAFRAKADGGSYGAVARVLTAAGVPTSHKIKGCDDYRTIWHTASARKLLTNRAYLGEHRCSCGCDQAQADAHPRLIDLGLFLRAQRAETVRKVSRGNGEGHLLSRLVRCACGYRMSFDATTRRGKVYGYYRCKGNAACPQRAIIPAGQLETWVVEQALERLGTLTHRTAAVDLTPLRDAVANTEAEVAEVEAAADELSPVAYGRALTRAQAALEEAQLALAEAEAEAGGMLTVWSPDEVRRIFTEAMPIPARREVLTQMIGEVTVRPAKKTEVAERASIGWADVESWREPEAVAA
ncbi:MAG TPA: recombinase family protein [Gaiellaceae bacterium]|nr:recombinase family protein [Gaiellaceae bacterium]